MLPDVLGQQRVDGAREKIPPPVLGLGEVEEVDFGRYPARIVASG
jgi:hypothetical protein